VLGSLGVLGCFEGACPSSSAVSFFDLIDILYHRKSRHLSYFLCVGCWWADYVASRSGVGVLLQFCFGWLWCSSGGPGVRVPFQVGSEV